MSKEIKKQNIKRQEGNPLPQHVGWVTLSNPDEKIEEFIVLNNAGCNQEFGRLYNLIKQNHYIPEIKDSKSSVISFYFPYDYIANIYRELKEEDIIKWVDYINQSAIDFKCSYEGLVEIKDNKKLYSQFTIPTYSKFPFVKVNFHVSDYISEKHLQTALSVYRSLYSPHYINYVDIIYNLQEKYPESDPFILLQWGCLHDQLGITFITEYGPSDYNYNGHVHLVNGYYKGTTKEQYLKDIKSEDSYAINRAFGYGISGCDATFSEIRGRLRDKSKELTYDEFLKLAKLTK